MSRQSLTSAKKIINIINSTGVEGRYYNAKTMNGTQCEDAFVEVYTSDTYRIITSTPDIKPTCGVTAPLEFTTQMKYISRYQNNIGIN